MLRRVAVHHEVWLASLVKGDEESGALRHLEEFCRGVLTARVERGSPASHLPGLFRYALAGRPLELKFAFSEEFARKLRALVTSIDFDVVEFQHSKMALYLDELPEEAGFKRILVLHNVTFEQYRSIARIGRGPVARLRAVLHSRMMRRWEPRMAERMDCCVTVSEADRALLQGASPGARVEVIPNGVDTRGYQPLPAADVGKAVLLVGKLSYAPGADAAIYFCREILPRVRGLSGDVETWIVGDNPPARVRELEEDAIRITGRVDSVLPYYRRCAVCVVPLRAGGGTRLKVLEAMALGRPVVSTSLGCEGLDVVDGEHLLIADTPERFAEKTALLLSNESLHRRLTANARRLVEERYAWDVIAGRQMELYSKLAQSAAARSAV